MLQTLEDRCFEAKHKMALVLMATLGVRIISVGNTPAWLELLKSCK